VDIWALDDPVKAGRLRQVGISDMPAWVSTGADDSSLPRLESPIALQIAFSLMERTVEGELVTMAQDTRDRSQGGNFLCLCRHQRTVRCRGETGVI
jgi:hypothetical protein